METCSVSFTYNSYIYIEVVNKGLFKAEKGLEDYLKAYKIEFWLYFSLIYSAFQC